MAAPKQSRRPAPTISLLCIALSAGGCGEEASTPGAGAKSAEGQSVVFGVLSDFAPGVEIDRLHVVLMEDGAVARDEVLTAAEGQLAFPLELRSSPMPLGTPVDLSLTAYGPGPTALVERRAASTVPGKTDTLFVVRLERECVPGTVVVDDIVASACAAGETCVGAACVDPFVGYAQLDPYAAGWAEDQHRCGPADAEPEAELGMGEDGTFAPLDGEQILARGGLQGGFHIYAGVRVRGLSAGYVFAEMVTDDLAGRVSRTTLYTDLVAGADACDGVDMLHLLPIEPNLELSPEEKIALVVGKAFHMDVRIIDGLGRLACDSRTVTVSEDLYVAD